jgi:tetratricopeptide (TPR) repeat protein
MAGREVLALSVLVAAAAVASAAGLQPSSPQDSHSSAGQAGKQEAGTSSSRKTHRIQVEAESQQPPELTQAEDAIQKHDYAAAEPSLRKLLERDPSNYVGWFDLGFVDNALGKVDESIAAYRKSVAAKADVFESNLNLGLQLAKTGDPDAAQFLRAATHLKPTAHAEEGLERAWLSLGHVLEKAKPEEAVAAFRQAAALEPKDAEPHLAAGQTLERQERLADAEKEYQEALRLDPASEALTGLANVYMRGRRFPEAEEYLRRLVAEHPQEAAVHLQLGRVLAAQNKNDAAIAELETAVKLAPADHSMDRELADLYAAAGKYDQAEAAYRKLVKIHPDDAGLHRSLGQTLLREKKFPEAQQEFLAAVKLKPDLGEAYGDLAFAAGENKDYPLVIKALDARKKFLPETAVTYFMRASAFDHLHDNKAAAANYHLFLNAANGKYPDQEWQARHRLIAIEPKK